MALKKPAYKRIVLDLESPLLPKTILIFYLDKTDKKGSQTAAAD